MTFDPETLHSCLAFNDNQNEITAELHFAMPNTKDFISHFE
jgi:hypothetical protein